METFVPREPRGMPGGGRDSWTTQALPAPLRAHATGLAVPEAAALPPSAGSPEAVTGCDPSVSPEEGGTAHLYRVLEQLFIITILSGAVRAQEGTPVAGTGWELEWAEVGQHGRMLPKRQQEKPTNPSEPRSSTQSNPGSRADLRPGQPLSRVGRVGGVTRASPSPSPSLAAPGHGLAPPSVFLGDRGLLQLSPLAVMVCTEHRE